MGNLITFTSRGLYVERADCYIDPWQPVKKAIITHAHADHAYAGHQYYLSHYLSEPVLRLRLGKDINLQTLHYRETITINGVLFTLYPAGHIIGSSQVAVSYKGETWVVSGDYKLAKDSLCTPFEPVQCKTFITESTFGLPIYKWPHQQQVMNDINRWWAKNREEGKTSIIFSYTLGKAQRILHNLDTRIGHIYMHGAIKNMNDVLVDAGHPLPDGIRVTNEIPRKNYQGNIVVAPPSALGSTWLRKFQPFSTAIASGWMSIRGARRRRAVDRGFVLSDHADWQELNTAVRETGAEKVYATHGYAAAFSRWLNEQGLYSEDIETAYEGELAEINEATQ